MSDGTPTLIQTLNWILFETTLYAGRDRPDTADRIIADALVSSRIPDARKQPLLNTVLKYGIVHAEEAVLQYKAERISKKDWGAVSAANEVIYHLFDPSVLEDERKVIREIVKDPSKVPYFGSSIATMRYIGKLDDVDDLVRSLGFCSNNSGDLIDAISSIGWRSLKRPTNLTTDRANINVKAYLSAASNPSYHRLVDKKNVVKKGFAEEALAVLDIVSSDEDDIIRTLGALCLFSIPHGNAEIWEQIGEAARGRLAFCVHKHENWALQLLSDCK